MQCRLAPHLPCRRPPKFVLHVCGLLVSLIVSEYARNIDGGVVRDIVGRSFGCGFCLKQIKCNDSGESQVANNWRLKGRPSRCGGRVVDCTATSVTLDQQQKGLEDSMLPKQRACHHLVGPHLLPREHKHLRLEGISFVLCCYSGRLAA